MNITKLNDGIKYELIKTIPSNHIDGKNFDEKESYYKEYQEVDRHDK